ncbi:hypothetical protein Pcinc_034969 [Petrolisthes cinctipes]|uniref:AB hydrolase-1 domain-containing protein n=1 Tax=Petrolisthes cinctipes TaxID=88211 RepID=A0AAE1BYV8_PETCI|nr:hypothetical protein Pcinc_034969 [Petrolisthes cinctipes]
MDVVWHEVWLEVGWGRLAAKTCITGGSQEAVDVRLKIVGLHGWMDNANTFDTLIPLLPAGLEVLVVDFPGHGYSDHLPSGAQHSIISYVINLYMGLHKYGWDRYVLMGHSLGGTVAVYYTALFPECVLALMVLDLVGPHAIDNDVSTWRKKVAVLIKMEEQDKEKNPVYSEEKALERLIKTRRGIDDITNINEDAANILLPRSACQVENGYKWRHDPKARNFYQYFTGGESFLFAQASIKCPVLLVLATHGVYLKRWTHILDSRVEVFRDNAKWFDMEEVEGRHHVHLSHPERVAPILTRFIKKVLESELHPPQSKL